MNTRTADCADGAGACVLSSKYHVVTPEPDSKVDPALLTVLKASHTAPCFYGAVWIEQLVLNLTCPEQASKTHTVHECYMKWKFNSPSTSSRNLAEDLLLFVGQMHDRLFAFLSQSLGTPRNVLENEYRSKGWVQDEVYYVSLAYPKQQLYTIDQENKLKDLAVYLYPTMRHEGMDHIVQELAVTWNRSVAEIDAYMLSCTWYKEKNYTHNYSAFQRYTNNGTLFFTSADITLILARVSSRVIEGKEYLQLWRELGKTMCRTADSVAACWREQRLLRISRVKSSEIFVCVHLYLYLFKLKAIGVASKSFLTACKHQN